MLESQQMTEQEPNLPAYPTTPGEGQDVFDLAWIACERCGMEEAPDFFPSYDPDDPAEMARFTSALLENDRDIIADPGIMGNSVGWCCPGCGNMEEFETYTFEQVAQFEY